MSGIGPDGYEYSGFMQQLAAIYEANRPTEAEMHEDIRRLLRQNREAIARLSNTTDPKTAELCDDIDERLEQIQLGFGRPTR